MKKILIIIIISIILVPFCIVFSSIIHFQLSKIPFMLDISVLVNSIISNKNHFLLFLITQLLAEFFVIYLFFFNKKGNLSTETNRITKNIRTPKVYGNGQYGTAKWASKKEMKEILQENVITTKGNEILKTDFKKRRYSCRFREKQKTR